MRSLSALPTSLLVFIAATTSALTSAETPETLDILEDGLIIEHVGGPTTCNRPTRSLDKISVNYRGTLQSDGTEFDSSYKRHVPFEFLLGAHYVIRGWDEGLLDMCIGAKRKLTIPSDLGYGDRGSGPIPGGATLIFDVELVDIVEFAEGPPAATTTSLSTSATAEAMFGIATAPPQPADQPESDEVTDKEGLISGESTSPTPDGSPVDNKPQQTECHLLGPFALMVQGALGALAILTLVVKRWREVPKRPWKIFFFDVSKQVFGSMLTHVINLTMSMLGAVDMTNAAAAAASQGDQTPGKSPNPCSFYLLNLGIDTTVGVPVLYFLLKILYHLFLFTPLASPPESIKSGHYGQPPKVQWYLKQLLIYSIGLIFMKLFVFFLFLAMPFLPWIGDWALRWTEGNEGLQIAFALFIFPLAMNAVQYYVIDSFIMDKQKDGGDDKGYTRVDGEDDEEERRDLYEEDVSEEDIHTKGGPEDGVSSRKLSEIDPVPIPAADPHTRGEGSRRGSPKDEVDKRR